MIVVFALLGYLAAVLVNRLADLLPRYASEPQQTSLAPLFALPEIFAKKQSERFSVRLAVELGSPIAFTFIWFVYGVQPTTAAGLAAAFTFLLLITVIDLRFRLILNVLVLPAMILVLVIHMLILRDNIAAVLVGGGMAFGIFYLTAMLRPGDLGGGDIKMAALIGFTFGFPGLLWALLIGAGAGALAAVTLIAGRGAGRKSTMAYGPFLCLGAMIALLYNPLL